nr:hypothetical protein [Tanacetum cinerariifolium]
MCDKKNKVLFTDSECLVLSLDFKLPDENQVLLKVPRENNMYNVNLKDIIPSGDLTCLFAKATIDESNLWHRRLGHTNFKTINKFVKGNLVRGLPTKVFENHNTCVTCKKDSLLPISFWDEAVNTACYVQNRVLVTKPHNKTPYELLYGRTPSIGFMRPFGCLVTILNTLDPLGKFKGKVDEGFLVGYSVNSKAFRVFNSRTRIVQETLHLNFLENKPNITGTGPTWLFDIDSLTMTMNYQPVTTGNQSNPSVGFQEEFNAGKAGEEANQPYMLFPVWFTGSSNPQNKEGYAAFDGKEHDAEKPESAVNLSPSSSALSGEQDDMTKKKDKGKSHVEYFTRNRDLNTDFEDYSKDNNNDVNAAGHIVPTAGQNYSNSTNPISIAGPSNTNTSPTHGKSSLKDASQPPEMLEREDIAYSDNENVGVEADFNNLETSITVSPIPTTSTHKDHLVSQIIGDLSSTTQTRSMTRVIKDQGVLSQIFNDDFHTFLCACFLSQEEPKRVHQALKDPSWIEAMQEELLQFKMQKVWILVDLPYEKRAIGFMVYEMDVKSAFLYGTIEEEVYVCQPLGGKIDQTLFIKKQKGDILLVQIYVDDIIFGAINKDLCKSFEKLMKDKFQMSSMGELTLFLGLQVKKKKDGIFISQDKYVAEILKKFRLTEGKSASTPIDTEKPLLKDPDGEDVDVHIYRSMIGSLMYLTSSRPTIMFAVCACVRFQVTLKASHLHAVKMIFRYLKGKPYLGLWYSKDSPFDLMAYSDSDYAGASLDRKSTTGGWQTTTGKEILNPFMAGSLPKTTLSTFIHSTKKKVVVTEATIKEALCLDDTEGVDCLSNEEIFTELARMVYEKPPTKLTFYKAFFTSQWKFLIHIILQSMSAKRTSWNEFSSAMASAMICLSIGRKFNFSKYIFDSLVRNVDSSLKFYMYHRFIHLIIQNQLGDLSTHTSKYISPTLTQKVFANMRRVGKGCSRVETPLFEGMLLAKEPEEHGDAEEQGTDDNVAEEPITAVALDACVALTRRVEHLEHDKVAQNLEITKLKIMVKKLERANKIKTLKLRRLRKVETSQRVDTSDDTVMKDVSNQGRMIDELDKDEGAVLMNENEETEEFKDITGDAQVEGRKADTYQINMNHAAKVLSMQEDKPEVQEAVEVVTTTKLITEVVTAVSEMVSAAAVVPAATVKPAPVKVAVPSTRRRRRVVIRDPKEESSAKNPTETKSKDKGKCIMVEEPKPIKKNQQVKLDEAYARKLHEELNQDIDWEVAMDHVKQKAKENPYVQRYQVIKKRPQTEAQARRNMMSKEQIEEEENRAIKSINETPAQKAARRRRLNEKAEDVKELKQHLEIMPNEDDDVEATLLARKVPVVDYQIIQLNNKPHFKIIRVDDDFLLTTLKAMFGRPDGQDQVWMSQRSVHGQAKLDSAAGMFNVAKSRKDC